MHPQFRIELFMGPYGAGKGTHGKRRVERLTEAGLQAEYLETSGLLKTVDDPRVREAMVSRRSAPLEVVCEIVETAIHGVRNRGAEVLVLDGFPRFFPGVGMKQVECFEEMVRRLGLRVAVIRFRASLDFCNRRIDARIEETRASGREPRRDDVDLGVRVPALEAYFKSEPLVLRRLSRFCPDFRAVTLTDPDEEFESVARRLDEAISARVRVDPGDIAAWTREAGSVPTGQIENWFRPEASACPA